MRDEKVCWVMKGVVGVLVERGFFGWLVGCLVAEDDLFRLVVSIVHYNSSPLLFSLHPPRFLLYTVFSFTMSRTIPHQSPTHPLPPSTPTFRPNPPKHFARTPSPPLFISYLTRQHSLPQFLRLQPPHQSHPHRHLRLRSLHPACYSLPPPHPQKV